MWFGYIKGHTLFDTENSVSTTFKKIYDVAVAYAAGALTGDVTGDLKGDVLAVDDAKIVDSAADIANSIVTAGSLVGALTGDVTGDVLADDDAKIIDSGADIANSIVTAASVVGTLTGLAIDGGTSNAATSGAVAIPITVGYQGYTTNSTAAIAATLADGGVGQEIWIKLETLDTNNLVVTPANFNNGSTITFDASGEVAHLKFIGTGWEVLYTDATVA